MDPRLAGRERVEAVLQGGKDRVHLRRMEPRMRKTLGPRSCTLLARFYDQLHGDAARWNRAARARVLGRILSRARSVCDLGCGTGTTALELARQGLRVYAVDLSPTMCRLARQKARGAGLPVRVICADMRTFRLPEQVDVVTCEFNPLNHLPRRTDLAGAARAVRRALQPGGYFYFDVNTRRALEEFHASAHWFEQQNFCMALHGGYDPRRKKGWSDVEWFLRAGKFWRRHRERIENLWWTDREVRSTLRRAGFSRLRSWDGAEVRPRLSGSRPGYDIYYLAQRPPR